MYLYDKHWDRLREVFLDLLEVCLSFHVTRSGNENIALCRTDQHLRESNLGGLEESLTIPLRTSLRKVHSLEIGLATETAGWPMDGGSMSGWPADGGI